MIPYEKQGLVSALYDSYTVSEPEYTELGVELYAVLDERGKGTFGKYIVTDQVVSEE